MNSLKQILMETSLSFNDEDTQASMIIMTWFSLNDN